MMKYKPRACELCGHEACLHCAADSAFLCFDCDARVHQANFLVARHVRQKLCCQCKCLTGKFISGERAQALSRPICPSCSDENPFDEETITSSTTSSDCISSTESAAATVVKKKIRPCALSPVSDISGEISSSSTESAAATVVKKKIRPSALSPVSDIFGEISSRPPRFSDEISRKNKRREKMVHSKAEGIFVIWCKRMGLSGNSIVPLACEGLALCLNRTTVLPFRVCLAASFWSGLRMHGDRSLGTWQNLRRLETVSGVPAKLIMAVETRLARVMTLRRDLRRI